MGIERRLHCVAGAAQKRPAFLGDVRAAPVLRPRLRAGSGAHSQCEDMCEKLISIQKLIYESFSKRIRKALEEYKDKVITEAEYLAKMRSIMEDYRYWL